jgi:RNA polymerase sigma-70 factor (ECF subfamily)
MTASGETPHSPAPEEDLGPLVEAAAAGRRDAFGRLVERFRERLFRMISYRVRNPGEAEDILQDVFVQALRHIGRLKDPARFQSWIYTIAVNRIRDHYRRGRWRSLMDAVFSEGPESLEATADPDGEKPLEALARQDFWRRMEPFLKQLSRMERGVFLLRFLDDLDIKEIADVVRKSESTVKTHLYRALTKFKGNRFLRDFLREAVP